LHLPVIPLLFGGSNGTANGTYYVLTSTNVTMPLANWLPLTTNQFDAAGNFVFSNDQSRRDTDFLPIAGSLAADCEAFFDELQNCYVNWQ
jgi:hypothetical protein